MEKSKRVSSAMSYGTVLTKASAGSYNMSAAYNHDPRHFRFARSLPRASAVDGPFNADPISNHWHDALAAVAMLAVVLFALFGGGGA